MPQALPPNAESAIQCEVMTEKSDSKSTKWLFLKMPNGQVIKLVIVNCEMDYVKATDQAI